MGIFDAFSSDAAKDASYARNLALGNAMQTSDKYYGQARDALKENYTAALQPWMNIGQQAGRGAQLYGDLTGANGPEGQARARALFQTDPGYQFQFDEAMRAAERGQAAGGQLASGNTLIALQDRANNLASTGYGNWAARLAPYLNLGTTAAAGQSGIYTGLGDRLAQSYTGQGGQIYQGIAQQGENAAKAEEDRIRASGQFWNTALGAAELGLKAAGVGGFAPKAPVVIPGVV